MRGHIKKTGERSYRVFLHVGKGKYKTVGVKGTRRDAERERARLVHELETGNFVEPSRLTTAEYLHKWLEYYQRNVRAKTFERDAELVRCHVIPALGNYPVGKLTSLDVDAFYSKALESGRRDGKGGLSPRTVRNIHRIVRAALGQGVRWRILARNVATDIHPPKPPHREMQVWDEPRMLVAFDYFRNSRLYAPVVTAATTGLRRGELLGLRWADVDFGAGRLSVARSLAETKQGLAFEAPKTTRSRRTLDLLPLTIETLRHHKAEQAAARLAAGPVWEDNDLIFPAPDGRPWKPSLFTDAFSDRLSRCKAVPRIAWHSLRHTHATQLLRAGVHAKVVSERLGHAGVSITLDLYSHVLPGMQAAAITALDTALRAAADLQTVVNTSRK